MRLSDQEPSVPVLLSPPFSLPDVQAKSMFYSKSWTSIGAIMATLGIILGTFGAHGVEDFLVEFDAGSPSETIAGTEVPAAYKHLETYKTATHYHMYHALGLIAVGILSRIRPKRSLQLAGWSFLLGIMLFSGSLYYYTLTGARWLGMVAPVGGTLFIIGWIALAVGASPSGSKHDYADGMADEPLT